MDPSETRGSLFTIPGWRPFADDLAAGLLAQFPKPLDLARVLLLLPTRRSIRALTEAFLRESQGAALLLPRMVPAGDLDLEEVEAFEGGPLFDLMGGASEARPAISPLARRLALAAILAGGRRLPAAEALAMGGQLGAALDTLEIEGKRAADLSGAVPEGQLQSHWEKNARVLEAVVTAWPQLLEARGLMDAAQRRTLQLTSLADRWAETSPDFPVVMAGFAAAPPAVAGLARVVARLPHGRLVLPGLDLDLPDAAWALLKGTDGEPALQTHPQYGMSRLLAEARLSPGEAVPWPWQSARAASAPERAALVARALLPADLGGDVMPAPPAQALSGLRMVEASNPAEEALVIALAMRQVVEHPGRTAALITPDRALAARVAVQLKRFGITVDDSAGTPLATTGPGSLLLALAGAAAERFAPVPLLALLQHPLVMAGEARVDWLNQVRQLDLEALRGIRPGPGLSAVQARLRNRAKAPMELRDWWADKVVPLLAPLERMGGTAQDLLETLRDVAIALAGDGLWAGEAGRTLARLFDALAPCGEDLARLAVSPDDAAAFAGALMAGETVRPRASLHPQLHIWGLLEARLQTADLILMGGLNEGGWPGLPAPDPFLAPAIRRALGLPGLARRTGQEAHQFASGLGAPEVLLTRAIRAGGAPTVASRFWQRLVAAAGGLPDSGPLAPGRDALLAVARGLDRPDAMNAYARPEPSPPARDRPREITVTDVALLKGDPFAFYAKRLLRLKQLEARDAEPTAGERGQVVHDILKRVLDEDVPPPQRIDELIDQELLKLGERPEIAALWRPRVERMVDWALAKMAEEADWTPLCWETSGEMAVGGIRLKGRADRVDSSGDGLRIVDYKTGRAPSIGEVVDLYQTQLALLGRMAEAGLFGDAGGQKTIALEYWKLSGGRKPGEIKRALGTKAGADEVQAHLDAALADFQELVGGWLMGDRPFRAPLHMVYGRRFGEYEQLARVAEWLGR